MSEVLELTTEETRISSADKRRAIEEELRKNSACSDREIGRLCGVDGKTVAAARKRLLGLAVEDAPTAHLAPAECPPPPNESEFDYFDPDGGLVAIPSQPAIAVYTNLFGAVVIRQQCLDYGSEDPFITVRPEYIERLIAKLRQADHRCREGEPDEQD
jgi:hypothetical protein